MINKLITLFQIDWIIEKQFKCGIIFLIMIFLILIWKEMFLLYYPQTGIKDNIIMNFVPWMVIHLLVMGMFGQDVLLLQWLRLWNTGIIQLKVLVLTVIIIPITEHNPQISEQLLTVGQICRIMSLRIIFIFRLYCIIVGLLSIWITDLTVQEHIRVMPPML